MNAQPPNSRERTTVLVIDDNSINRKLISLALRSDGFDVRTAPDGVRGLDVVRAVRPTLVYTDVQMPGIDGLEFAARIKAEPDLADTIVIALTALAMPLDHDRALAAGCDGFLAKPIDTRSIGFATDQFLAAGPRLRERS
jgi:CheY-like chemotaxis protein